MPEVKAVNFDVIYDDLRKDTEGKSFEDRVKRIVQFCREADLATAESALTHYLFCAFYNDEEWGVDLLIRKVVANKAPEQLLQFLIVSLPKNQKNIFIYNELNQVFFEKLKNNLEFRKLFISSQSSRRIEIVLSLYCSRHPEDKKMQEILAEYQKVQNTPEMIKKRQTDFLDEFREIYGLPKSPHPLSTYQNDIIQIALFLSNPERMLLRLKELEALIEFKAKSESQIEARDEKNGQSPKLKGYIKGQPYKEYKLLSSVLYALAKKFGFNEPVTLWYQLPSKEFYQNLKEKHLFKDAVLGDSDSHGEWVHFIQWICIALESQANSGFLSNPVASVFQWIGEQAESEDPIKHLWTNTFDAFNSTPKPTIKLEESKLDFRVPSNLYRYLLTSAEATVHYPLMQQLLQGRVDKRLQQQPYNNIVYVIKFLCTKHSKNETVNKLKASLETKSKAEKPIKSAKLLKAFGIYFHKVENQLPPEFVTEVEKHLSKI